MQDTEQAPEHTAMVSIKVEAEGSVYDAEGNLISTSPIVLEGTMSRAEAEARGIPISDEEQ